MFFTQLLPLVVTDHDGGDGSDLLHIIFPSNGCQLYNFSMLSFHLKTETQLFGWKGNTSAQSGIEFMRQFYVFLLLDGSSHHLFSTPLTSGPNCCSLWHQHIFNICQMWFYTERQPKSKEHLRSVLTLLKTGHWTYYGKVICVGILNVMNGTDDFDFDILHILSL